MLTAAATRSAAEIEANAEARGRESARAAVAVVGRYEAYANNIAKSSSGEGSNQWGTHASARTFLSTYWPLCLHNVLVYITASK